MKASSRPDRTAWIAIVAIAVVIAGTLTYVMLNSATQRDTQTNASDMPAQPQASHNSSQNSNEPTTKPGEYTDYTPGYFEQVAGQTRRLLFFHANWCPQCRALENGIKAQGVPSGITIFKVNYDTADALKQLYKVTLQTTVIEVDEHGSIIDKFVAYDQPTLQATLTALPGNEE